MSGNPEATWQALQSLLDSSILHPLAGVIRSHASQEMDSAKRDELNSLFKHFVDCARSLISASALTQDGGAPMMGVEDEYDNGNDDSDSDDDNKMQGSRKRCRRSPVAHQTRDPWRPVRRLRSVQVPTDMTEFINGDVSKYFGDKAFLQNTFFEGRRNGECSDVFLACYDFTLKLESRMTIDQTRWLFTMMMYYDLAKLIRPEATGTRVGELQAGEIANFLGPLLQLPHVDLGEIVAKLNTWVKMGRRLSFLCGHLGTGCIFVLSEQLTRNFLSKKCPLSGQYFDGAMDHLRALKIHSLPMYAQASDFGSRLRAAHINLFKDRMV